MLDFYSEEEIKLSSEVDRGKWVRVVMIKGSRGQRGIRYKQSQVERARRTEIDGGRDYL